jgi:hypothetical protein
MERVPQLPVPVGIVPWFDDFDMRRRCPSPFDDRRFDALGIDRASALAELADVFTPDDVRKLVEAGHAWLVYGLFGGLFMQVEDKLLLGADLVLCMGWRDQKQFVGGLRSASGHHERRIEAGVWAGLRRVGCDPSVELANNRSDKRADFVVDHDGLRIAIELKTRSDPAFERICRELTYLLASTISFGKGFDWRGDVDLKLSGEAHRWLARPSAPRFVADHWKTFEKELKDNVGDVRHGVEIVLPSIGTLVVRKPAFDDGTLGSYRLDGVDHLDAKRLAELAVHKVREAAEQLAATSADLRVAVVHGSAEVFDADRIVHALPAALAMQRDDLIVRNVDWVVMINCEGVSPSEPWLRRVAVLPMPSAKRDLPARVVHGLVAWGRPRG